MNPCAAGNCWPIRREVLKLITKAQQKGLTLIPTRMYFKNGRVKVEVAVARGKQLWDKRETERRREADREARQAIARARKLATDVPQIERLTIFCDVTASEERRQSYVPHFRACRRRASVRNAFADHD